DNIINNKGGLHNRLTRHILLNPFTLKESELFYKDRNIPFTRLQTAEAYMIFGGIPYYMNLFMPHLSLYQNVDAVYFNEGAELRNEFENLYKSLWSNSEIYMHVINTLATKGIGMTRNEIANGSGLSDGGNLTKILHNLIICGFIRKYKTYGNKEKDSLYQLVDFFSMFDIKFRSKKEEYSNDYWLQISTTPLYHAWSGFSYEKLCLLHIPQIMKKLGISGIRTAVYAWSGDMDGSRSQIDLVIERADKVINLCEVKFSSGVYAIEKKYAEIIRNKRLSFAYNTKTRSALHNTMITTYGVVRNIESAEIISTVVLDDLFE
ncbi:MAG: ATP-binding protein, partial [Clostridiales bacterium]|nr:ATP-binding protein [Clostridiales bacterium]